MRPPLIETAPCQICTAQATCGSGQNQRSDDSDAVAQAYLKVRRSVSNQAGHDPRIRCHVVGEDGDIAPWVVVGNVQLRRGECRPPKSDGCRRGQTCYYRVGERPSSEHVHGHGLGVRTVSIRWRSGTLDEESHFREFGEKGRHGVRREAHGARVPDHVRPGMHSIESSQQVQYDVWGDSRRGRDEIGLLRIPPDPDGPVALGKYRYSQFRSAEHRCVHNLDTGTAEAENCARTTGYPQGGSGLEQVVRTKNGVRRRKSHTPRQDRQLRTRFPRSCRRPPCSTVLAPNVLEPRLLRVARSDRRSCSNRRRPRRR